MALPVVLSTYAWPADGIGYMGPYISSTGLVCVFGSRIIGSDGYVSVWKATDPTSAFTVSSAGLSGSDAWTAMNAVAFHSSQTGDIINIIASGNASNIYRHFSFNMLTETFTPGLNINIGAAAPINRGAVITRRGNGDLIAFVNMPGVVNMGKTYGRIAAYRLASGGGAWGSASAISIAIAATTLQSESVDSACLGTSDRVHLFWTQTNATAAFASSILYRTVKSTDNLDGTAPATASGTVTTSALGNVSPADGEHFSGQAFCSPTGVISLMHCGPSTSSANCPTATSADTMTFSPSSFTSTHGALVTAFGATVGCVRFGGSPWDGTDRYVVWQATSLNKYYNKNSGGWVGDVDLSVAEGGSQVDQLSANIYQRGSNIVLATVIMFSSGGTKYNEVVLRSAGPATQTTSISPAIFTLTSVALTKTTGDANRTLTNAALTLTLVALTTSIGGVTCSISPVTVTLTPVAITGQATIDPQFASISPAIFTLTPIALAKSVGTASHTLTPATFTLSVIGLTTSVGGTASVTLGVTIFTLTPIALSPTAAPSFITITPVIFTLTPIAITRGVDTSARTISPAIVTFTPIAISRGVDTVSRTLTPAQFVLTPIALTRSVGGVTSSISSATVTLTPIALVRTLGTTITSVTPAIFTLTPIALTQTVGGTASGSISPAIVTLTAIAISGFVVTPGVGNIVPVTITLTPIALVRSVGAIFTSVSPVSMALSAQPLARSTADTVSRTLTPAQMTFTAIALSRTVGTSARTLSPVITTLTPIALTRSVGPVSGTLIPVTVTFTPVALVRSIGTVNLAISPTTITLTPIGLTRSVGTSSYLLSPVIMMLTPIQLVPGGLGGEPKWWDGSAWVDKPVKWWNGSAWVTKPMKVWNGSSWVKVNT